MGYMLNQIISLKINRDDVGGEFPYMTMCIKESLRTHPPVPVIVRDLTNPLTVDGVTLLPGSTIVIAVWMAHHNESVWGKDHMVRLVIFLKGFQIRFLPSSDIFNIIPQHV